MQHDTDPEVSRKPGRGLGNGHIRRGTATRWAIRTIRVAQRTLKLTAEVLVAIVIVFEEWGWRPLAALLAQLARFELIARLERGVAALPPWPALGVFLVPSVLFFPLKLVALWLIAGGHAVSAALVFAFAKVAGTALYARIFQLTQPALMQLAWFARLYNWFMPWKEAIVAAAKATPVWRAAVALKLAAKDLGRRIAAPLKPAALALVARLRAAFGR
jgi:hypothetical protein